VLVRHHLVAARQRKKRREDYVRWERDEPMQLWQLDITGSLWLADGSEVKLVTGLDDHSRYCVIAKVVVRATGRRVCAAFAAALETYGVPEEVLTDNGKQFHGTLQQAAPGRGAVRTYLQGERHHRPAHRDPDADDDRQDRAFPRDPAIRASRRQGTIC
jgi:transposase InsO family protein